MRAVRRPIPYLKNRGRAKLRTVAPITRVRLNLSDSESGSSSSIQVVDVFRPNLTHKIEYSSDYSSSQYSDSNSQEIDWNSPNISKQTPIRSTIQTPLYHVLSDSNNNIIDLHGISCIANDSTKSSQPSQTNHNLTIAAPQSAITPSQSQPITSHQQTEINSNLHQFSIQAPPSMEFQNYLFTREKLLSKEKFQLRNDDFQLLFRSSEKKKQSYMRHKIYSNDSFIAYIEASNGNSLMTLYTTQLKDPRDDRKGEMLFVRSIKETSTSSLTAILPINNQINYPISDRLTLKRIFIHRLSLKVSDPEYLNAFVVLESSSINEELIANADLLTRV